ncbi:MAG TPA: DUF87 domain-containing protein [Candidatus Jorgensenbacteria bacterium]|nr:DUF87 domain-containing protein [Candidatus Jorgensenbacteria bacterium]
MPVWVHITLAGIVGIVGIVGIFVTLRARRRAAVERLRTKLFLLRFPRGNQEGTDVMHEIGRTEQLFSAVAGFHQPIVFEAAVPHVGEEILFYAAVPSHIGDAFVRQVHAIWSDASVEEVDDYNIFHHSGITLGGWVKSKEEAIIPIATYRYSESDTFQPILGGLAKVDEMGEGGAVQVILRPAAASHKREVQKSLQLLRKGWNLKDLQKRTTISNVFSALSGKAPTEEERQRVDENTIRAVEEKARKPLLEVNVRLVASAPSQVQAESIFSGLVSAFAQFSSPDRNELSVVKARSIKKFAHRFSFREFSGTQAMVLNTEEVASIFHFPTPFTDMPRVKYLKAKQLAPPSVLPDEGTLIGESVYRGERRSIYITDNDRRRHVYAIGQTGTGKSTLLINIVMSDIERGKGVAVIDPHGDLVQHIASLIPKQRQDDVIIFDPSSLEKPLGLNMLEYDLNRPEEKTFVVNELMGILDKLYDLKTTGGPMFEQYMRNALLLLMDDAAHEVPTLMEVPRIFTDADYRNQKLARITNPSVIDFWEKEAVKAGGEASLQNITPYITSKFSSFIANDYMRVIIGQERSAFNFREIMDEGKILLVNLSKGRIGDLNANLLGMIIVGKFLMAALGRADIPESERRDFNVVIDEFQNFTTDSIATILSEARKYRLSVTLAHQFIAQLNDKTRDAVFGNVGSFIAFRVGVQDAEFLVKQFEPFLAVEDLVNVDNYNAYVKLLVRGETARPFNIQTFVTAPYNEAEASALYARSMSRYGVPKEEVERTIRHRLQQ